MPLIERLKKNEKEAFTVRLNRGTAEELRQYCQFLDSPQDYIIAQALELVFRKDKEFTRWKEDAARTPETSSVSPAEPPARTRMAKA